MGTNKDENFLEADNTVGMAESGERMKAFSHVMHAHWPCVTCMPTGTPSQPGRSGVKGKTFLTGSKF